MDWKQIVGWLLTIATTVPDKLPQTLDAIELILGELQRIATLWGINVPALQSEGFNAPATGVDPELEAAEKQIEDCLKANAGEGRGAIDFSRVKAILLKAKELGVLDVVMALLVKKVPLPV